MEIRIEDLNRKIRLGWLVLVIGVIFLLVGIGLELFAPTLLYNPKIITSLGIMIIGWAVGRLVKYLPGKKSAEAAKRLLIDDQDERQQVIRFRSGFKAFELTFGFSGFALIVFSSLSRYTTDPVLFDGVWYYMIFMLLAPLAVYLISMMRNQNRY